MPPADAGAVAQALDLILSNPSMRHSMGRAARQRVEEYFSMDRYVLRVLSTYQKAIGEWRQRCEHQEDEDIEVTPDAFLFEAVAKVN